MKLLYNNTAKTVCLCVVCCGVQVQGMVDNYKGANLDIANVGKGISELLLVRIDPHRVYENLEFEEDQVFDIPPPPRFLPLRC